MENIARPCLEMRDLRLVLALAAGGTTAQAAATLHLSQPAVSRALLTVEERLGVPLFQRSARGLTLTDAGERLVDGAQKLLAGMVDLELRVRAPAVTPTRLRVVCECYTAYHWLPSAMSGLRASFPDLDIDVALEHTAEPVAALEAGKIDAALLTTAAVPKTLGSRPLFSDEVVFVLAATHPLARRAALTLDDLLSHTLITSPTPMAEFQWFRNAVFGRARPKVRYHRLPLTEAILDVTRAGMGIAVLSEWMAAPHLGRGELVARRLDKGPLRRPWRLAWRHEIDDAAARLHAALSAAAPRHILAA